MFHTVLSIYPDSDYVLRVGFSDGTEKRYDVKQLFSKWPVFQALQTVDGLFQSVKVDPGGYGISWNDKLDLSCDELYKQGN